MKSVSDENLARFKEKCDETYQKKGEGGRSGGGISEAQVIVQVDEVPATVTADSPSFIQTPDGTLYRKHNTTVDLGTPTTKYEYLALHFAAQSGYYKPVAIYEAAVIENITTTSSGTMLNVSNVFTSYIGPTDVVSLMEGLKNCFFMAILTFEIAESGGGIYRYDCYLANNAVRVINNVAYLTIKLPNDSTLADDANSSVQITVTFKNKD